MPDKRMPVTNPKNTTLILDLDPDDLRAVEKAVTKRSQMIVPDAESNLAGQLIAEICRGWMEFMDKGAK